MKIEVVGTKLEDQKRDIIRMPKHIMEKLGLEPGEKLDFSSIINLPKDISANEYTLCLKVRKINGTNTGGD